LKFFETPTAFVAAVMVAILAFGLGLTSPMWFLLDGRSPVDAIHAGTPIVVATIGGMVVTLILGLFLQRYRKPDVIEVETYAEPVGSRRKGMIVHVITLAMFIVPFLTIILGILLKSVIDADS